MAKSEGTTKAATPIDTSDWQKEQVGFDPYWKAAEGKSFIATFLRFDGTDPKFHRYQFMALTDMECQRGPGDEEDDRHEKVTVKPGETFNISEYHSLIRPLQEYVSFSEDTGVAVTMRLTCGKSVETKSGNDVWLWTLEVPPKVKAALSAWRKEHSPKALKAGNAAREQLQDA